jgi:dCTP deaminase
MILSDYDIIERIAKGSIVIEPSLEAQSVQPSGVDFTLGDEFATFRAARYGSLESEVIDPKRDNPLIYFTYSDCYIMQPNEFLLGTTVETIKIPDDLVARVEGRSSIGRLGLTVHSTAGYIDPGFEGQITLELTNHTNRPWCLYPGMRICQIIFEELKSPAIRPYGHQDLNSKYQKQKGVQGSLIHFD